MFTGIVKALCPIGELKFSNDLLTFSVRLPKELLEDLSIGASISVNGVCLTVISFDAIQVWFEVINETLEKTNLKRLHSDSFVNIERSLRYGDEVGGHLLSGHIYGEVQIQDYLKKGNQCIVSFKVPNSWIHFLMPKGYVAIDGASLTIVDVNSSDGIFSVHLIPETLKKTTLGMKKVEDFVNIEFDSQTQTIVETIERFLSEKYCLPT